MVGVIEWLAELRDLNIMRLKRVYGRRGFRVEEIVELNQSYGRGWRRVEERTASEW